MGRKLELSSGGEGELGDDNEFPQFEGCGDHGLAESSQIVLVGATKIFNAPRSRESFRKLLNPSISM
jgi:hypothetical protein